MQNWKALVRQLHLWLGLGSGLIVFIVSITGCIYVFQNEIMKAVEPWRVVDVQNQAFVPPSQLIDTASFYLPGKTPSGLTYEDESGTAAVGFYYTENGLHDFAVAFLNPYTGKLLHKKESVFYGDFDFFQFVIKGHRFLWLPPAIGKPVVGIGVLLFVVLLITGLIMWCPVKWNAKNRERSFRIKWRTGWKRLNLDLHNVPGFYAALFLLIIACTGLVWSFKWFDQGLYYVLSGGEKKAAHEHPHSVVPQIIPEYSDSIPAIDRAFYLALKDYPNPKRIYMTPQLREANDAIEVVLYKHEGRYYHHDEYFFDRYTLELLDVEKYDEAGFADKLDHMYYDMHTGAILGLPGKILAFLLSLVSASLPVTGFFVWYNKRRKSSRQARLLQSK